MTHIFSQRGPGPIIVIPNLAPDRSYRVSVSAVNGAGESPKSEEVSLKTANHGSIYSFLSSFNCGMFL